MSRKMRACAGAVVAALSVSAMSAGAAALTENFDEANGFFGTTGTPGNLPSVPGVAGWAVTNNSTAGGTKSWFSGSAASRFTPQSGTGFAAVDKFSTADTADISNWLFTPQLTFSAGDQVSFFTRTFSPATFPDRLQVRLSTNGASTNVGSTPSSVGDFTTVLLDINPNLQTIGYPTAWVPEQVNIPVSGSGRLAFRYFVNNGGPSGPNADMIGIDSVSVTPEPGAIFGTTLLSGVAMLMRRRRSAM